eukprot:TRINITY_DN40390_c0_g1_i1.p1 TRINITY_DN40390_c0_g1~~TRINITY_DN40390_c0_g1_i1.p1  ORF type:complete len:703 (-),score=171.65 TRINITY_DN40390_c0_g1_i1:131-2209(-)
MVTAVSGDADRLKADGNEKLKAGQPKEALALYEKALSLLSTAKGPLAGAAALSLSLCLNASLASLRLEDWEQAEAYASRALRLSPKSSKAFYRRGLARSRLPGIEADARRDFENALELEPKGEGAQMVRMELERLKSGGVDGAAFDAPQDADPQDVRRFETLNAKKEVNGGRKVTWAEWTATEKRVSAASAEASAWRKRMAQASKCPQSEGTSDADARASLSACLDELLTKPAKQRPAAGELVVAKDQALALPAADPDFLLGSGGSGVCMLAPGPWLFNGKSCKDIPFESRANPADAFTVEVWAACNGAFGHQCVLASRDQAPDGQSKSGYMFYVEPEGIWSFWVGAGSHWEKLYGPQVDLGRWTHLRGVVDPAAREAHFYVDRRLAVTQTSVDFCPNVKRPLRLGAGRSEGEAHFFFNGDLRDVCVLGRSAGDDDLTEELASAAKSKASKAQHAAALERLPDMLRRGNGSGLASGGSALCAGLKWCTAAASLPSSGLGPGSTGQVDEFRRAALKFLESGSASSAAEGNTSVLFLSFNLQAALLLEKNREALCMSFGAGLGQQHWAVVLRCGQHYKILYEAEGLCTLAEALERQAKLRPQSQGWLTQKDAVMWLTALDSLAFSLDSSEVEDALLTVFYFGYWASSFLSPEVRLENFDPAARSSTRVQATLADGISSEALAKVTREVTSEAAR